VCRVRAWALCHAASLPPGATSDKAHYGTPGAGAGAPAGQAAPLHANRALSVHL